MTPPPPVYVELAPYGVHDREVVAATLIGEAGGEQWRGMQAVFNVIWNRAGGNPALVKAACLAPHVFSCWNGKEVSTHIQRAKNHPCWAQALQLAEMGLRGKLADLTGGANHFYDPKRVHPHWAGKMRQTAVIGGHTFLKD